MNTRSPPDHACSCFRVYRADHANPARPDAFAEPEQVCARRHTQMHKAQEPGPDTQKFVAAAGLRNARNKRQRQVGQ